MFNLLAIGFKRRHPDHATYMFSLALTLPGPTLDRVLFQVYRHFGIRFNVFAEFFVFAVMDGVLVALPISQIRKGYPIRAGVLSFAIYLAGQKVY